jgi:hypothetical protein
MNPNNLFLRVRNSSLLWGMMAVFGFLALLGGLFFATAETSKELSRHWLNDSCEL